MLWPRGLGEVVEAVPWGDCFPTINFALPPSPSCRQSLQSCFHLLVLQPLQGWGARGWERFELVAEAPVLALRSLKNSQSRCPQTQIVLTLSSYSRRSSCVSAPNSISEGQAEGC